MHQVSLLGCCSAVPGPDFSKMALQDVIGPSEISINFEDWSFWLSFLGIILVPCFWAMHSYLQSALSLSRDKPHLTAESRKNLTLLDIVGLLLGLHRHWGFRQAVLNQPSWEFLMNNVAVTVGDVLIITGLTISAYCVLQNGFSRSFVVNTREAERAQSQGSLPSFTSLVRVSTVLLYTGYSVLCTSLAGLTLTFVLCTTYLIF